VDFRGRVPFITGLLVVLVFVLIAIEPPLVLFLLFLAYASSGPVFTVQQLRRHREARRMAHHDEPPQKP
jgi:CDP-diacylglycerol--serine O-phosphatidyltransferase